jgi:hypothetical protein
MTNEKVIAKPISHHSGVPRVKTIELILSLTDPIVCPRPTTPVTTRGVLLALTIGPR